MQQIFEYKIHGTSRTDTAPSPLVDNNDNFHNIPEIMVLFVYVRDTALELYTAAWLVAKISGDATSENFHCFNIV